MNWVITFDPGNDNTDPFYHKRIAGECLAAINSFTGEKQYIIDYLEATGEWANHLSDQRQPGVSLSDLTRLFSEDGQIIELRLHTLFDGKVRYKFEIRDGAIFDLLGKGDKSFLKKIGVSYKELNPQLFGW